MARPPPPAAASRQRGRGHHPKTASKEAATSVQLCTAPLCVGLPRMLKGTDRSQKAPPRQELPGHAAQAGQPRRPGLQFPPRRAGGLPGEGPASPVPLLQHLRSVWRSAFREPLQALPGPTPNASGPRAHPAGPTPPSSTRGNHAAHQSMPAMPGRIGLPLVRLPQVRTRPKGTATPCHHGRGHLSSFGTAACSWKSRTTTSAAAAAGPAGAAQRSDTAGHGPGHNGGHGRPAGDTSQR